MSSLATPVIQKLGTIIKMSTSSGDSKTAENSKELDELTEALSKSIREAITVINSIGIANHDHYSKYPQYKDMMESQGKETLALISSIVKKVGIDDKYFRKANSNEDKFETLCDINDKIMDKIIL